MAVHNKQANGKPSAYDRWTERAAITLNRLKAEDRLPLTSPIKPGIVTRPYNGLTGAWYWGSNHLHLHLTSLVEMHAEHRWLTYRQAARMGGQVRKGEKGSLILIFKPARDNDADDGRERRGYFGAATVFNAAQIDGLEPADVLEVVDDLTHVEAIADAFVQATGAEVIDSEVLAGSELGAYRSSADRIRMRPRSHFQHNAEYYSTLLHELAHWTGHASRMGREPDTVAGSEGYAEEELVAEMTAFTLSQTLGLGFESRLSARYLDHYEAQLSDPDALAKAAGASTAIVRYLCELADPKGALVPRQAKPATVNHHWSTS